MNGEIISIETANKLGKAKKLEIENIKLKSDNELYKHLYEIELKRNKELQEKTDKAIEWVKKNMYYFPRPDELLNILQGEDTNVKDKK